MLKYTFGDRVAHTQYGDGTVSSVNEYHTVIDFDAHGVFVAACSALSVLDTDPCQAAKTARRVKRPPVKTS
jgi:hypothetical protein